MRHDEAMEETANKGHENIDQGEFDREGDERLLFIFSLFLLALPLLIFTLFLIPLSVFLSFCLPFL